MKVTDFVPVLARMESAVEKARGSSAFATFAFPTHASSRIARWLRLLWKTAFSKSPRVLRRRDTFCGWLYSQRELELLMGVYYMVKCKR